MAKIYEEERDHSRKMFEQCVNEEKAWAKYLFKDGSLIGLSEQLLYKYVEWICNRRMKAIGLSPLYDVPAATNPLPWTEHWLKSKGVQVAPQETEVESYIIGGVKQDIKEDAFAGFQL
jgi:ribonucleoside-diphosphate reductase beta chain